MKKRFFSLEHKVLICFILLSIVPIILTSYMVYKQVSVILKENIAESNLSTVQQIGSMMEHVVSDVNKVSLHIIYNEAVRQLLMMPSDTSHKDISQLNNEIYEQLLFHISSTEYIDSMYIEGDNGLSFTINGTGLVISINEELQKRAIEKNGGSIWVYEELETVNVQRKNVPVYSQVRLINDYLNIEPLGILRVNVKEENIAKIYEKDINGKKGSYYIIDSNQNIISSSDKKMLNSKINKSLLQGINQEEQFWYYETVMENKQFLVTYYYMQDLDWYLINLIPIEDILSEMNIIRNITVMILVISIIICIILSRLISYKFLHPLKELKNVMEDVEQEDFSARLTLKRNDEIGILAATFNKMSKRLEELLTQVYYAKIMQKEAELKALEAQINPHFLYNTLDVIYWKCRMEKAHESERLIIALSKLFRLTLNKGNEFTTLGKELDHLKSYMTIQQVKYEDDVTFSINVDDDILDCKVIKLVLQPIVENALIHGVGKRVEEGNIWVKIIKQQEDLVYIIKDDGIGIDQHIIDEILYKKENSQGYGMKNVNERIRLHFGEGYGIDFFSEEGKGVTVLVKQPFIRGDGLLNDQNVSS
ncbi:sensor histidine kinase [Vallitalea okinawensis]|uniref:sensor histidine kinase n=1 Tax=Vallitalea okinawensis TaxID=2078660 RepID=UPI000CFB5D20|nr:sensor histidine kinase [Vallitalea okinawensis]